MFSISGILSDVSCIHRFNGDYIVTLEIELPKREFKLATTIGQSTKVKMKFIVRCLNNNSFDIGTKYHARLTPHNSEAYLPYLLATSFNKLQTQTQEKLELWAD